MYQHKLYVIPYTEENISRTIKSFAENHERGKKKLMHHFRLTKDTWE